MHGTSLRIAAALIALAVAPLALDGAAGSAAFAAGNCEPGDKVDNSTATDAKKKIEAAGYSQVRDLKKGCDNVWHAKAVKDGAPANLALGPDGQVRRETD